MVYERVLPVGRNAFVLFQVWTNTVLLTPEVRVWTAHRLKMPWTRRADRDVSPWEVQITVGWLAFEITLNLYGKHSTEVVQ